MTDPVINCSHTWRVKIFSSRSQPLVCPKCKSAPFVHRYFSVGFLYVIAGIFGPLLFLLVFLSHGLVLAIAAVLALQIPYWLIALLEWRVQSPQERTVEMRKSDAQAARLAPWVIGAVVVTIVLVFKYSV
ncbi:MAG: hypothetical protein QNJ07_16980 [Woeseiaceae bacterium]|nr:hypothetical protein [Woeseiaceae bacterium]